MIHIIMFYVFDFVHTGNDHAFVSNVKFVFFFCKNNVANFREGMDRKTREYISASKFS